MNTYYSKAMLVALPFLFYFGYNNSQPNIPAEDPDYSRFHNVTEWEGKIKITFSGTSSNNSTTYRDDQEYNFSFTTSEGIKTMADPFGGGSPYGDISEEDLRSGNYDPMELARQVRMNQNAFRQWGAGHGVVEPPFVTEITAKVTSEMSKTFETHSGEGGKTCTINERERSFANGKNEAGALLLIIDKNRGTYSFLCGVTGVGIEQTTKHTYSPDHCGSNKFENRVYTTEDAGRGHFNESINEVKIVNQKLPVSGLTMTGMGVIRDRLKMQIPDSENMQDIDIHVQWTIYPKGEKQPEYYAEITDKEWVPELDNWVGVELNHQEGTPQKVRFTLFDYSSEPGTYLNSEDDNEDPDLEFDPKMEELGYVIKKEGESFTATLDNPVSGRSTAIILSHDYGAYGKVKSEVYVDGAWQVVRDKGTQKPNISIPWDDNENHIADHWEEETGILGMNLDANWDEDPYPKEQANPGDGLTLYEEYRGFISIDHTLKDGSRQQETVHGHFRSDPLHKDIFIYDYDRLFMKYYAQLNPSELNWHLINKTMMQDGGYADNNYRVINFNTSKKIYLDQQYAMVLKFHDRPSIAMSSQGVAITMKDILTENDSLNFENESFPANCSPTPKQFKNPLECIVEIRIIKLNISDLALIFDKNDANNLYDILMRNTVIHEVGHGIGIRHHGMEVDITGNAHTFEWEMQHGVLTCAMRYEAINDLKHPNVTGLTRYCRDGEYWFEMIKQEGDFDSIPRKKYPSHNCWKQINIKGK